MKRIIYLTVLVSSYTFFAQKYVMPNDSIKVRDICFNNVCMGDSLTKAFKIFGKPDEVKEFEWEDEDNPDIKFKHTGFSFGSRQKELFFSYFSKNNVTLYGFLQEKNKKFIFGKGYSLKIGSNFKEIQKIFPNSYKEAVRSHIADSLGAKNRYDKLIAEFESIKKTPKYLKDKSYKDSKDKEYNIRLEKEKPFYTYTTNHNNYFVYVKIYENDISDDIRLVFYYTNNKLESVSMEGENDE